MGLLGFGTSGQNHLGIIPSKLPTRAREAVRVRVGRCNLQGSCLQVYVCFMSFDFDAPLRGSVAMLRPSLEWSLFKVRAHLHRRTLLSERGSERTHQPACPRSDVKRVR